MRPGSIRHCTARLLLALMLTSLLSPAMGWAMVADHHELAQAATAFGADGEHAHADGDAHAWFGHVLGHLPGAFAAEARLHLALTVEVELPEQLAVAAAFLSAPPLRPPLPLVS